MNVKRYYDRNGYARIKINGKLVGEHRVIMEELLGRPLTPSEVVHHKNEIKGDNSPTNLEMKENSEHVREHIRQRTKPWPTLTCPECGRGFTKRPNKVRFASKKQTKIFCSRSCSGKYSNRIKENKALSASG